MDKKVFEQFYNLLKRKSEELENLKNSNFKTKLTVSIPASNTFKLDELSDVELSFHLVPILLQVKQGLEAVGKPTKLSGYEIDEFIDDAKLIMAKRNIKKLEKEFKELEAKINAIAPDTLKIEYEVQKLQKELEKDLGEDITNLDK